MNFLLYIFVSIFLYSTLFSSNMKNVSNDHIYKIAKQDLNLSGRDVINYIDNINGVLYIDEKAYMENLCKYNEAYAIAGGIFCYKDKIRVVKNQNNEFKMFDIDIENMDKSNIINTINNMMNYVVNGIDCYEINIDYEYVENILYKEFHNELKENTIFIIGNIENRAYISGFCINNESYQHQSVENVVEKD